MLGGAYFRLGMARTELGRYEQARQALQMGFDHAEESGDRHNLARLLNTLGGLHAELGDTEAALRYHQQALEVSHHGATGRVAEAECYALINLATDELRAGHVDAAEAHLRAFEPLLDHGTYSRFRYLNRYQLVQAELALLRADYAAARRWSEEAKALAAAKEVPKNLAKSCVLQGRALLALGHAGEAADLLRQGLATADQLAHGALRWQARLWLGQAYTALRRPDAAADLYRQAQDQVQALASALDDERLRACFLASPLMHELQASAAAVTAPPTKPVYPAGLTAREVEVLRLVARGETNLAIAKALFISVKTVDAHMVSILGKTACANRAAAAAFALRHGLV
jgi:ATP/maltotriose-dependent transcriptional regulator MalT